MTEPATKTELISALIAMRDVQASVIQGVLTVLKRSSSSTDADASLDKFLEMFDQNMKSIDALISAFGDVEPMEKGS